MPGLFELLILSVPAAVVAGAVALGLYFGIRRPRSMRARPRDLNPPDGVDKQ
jgi:hypothetical protein